MKNKKIVKVTAALFVAGMGVGFTSVPMIDQKTSIVQADASTDFVNKMSDSVQNTARKNNLYSSVTLAQMILESSYGKSELATKANNYFGIKGNYNGASYSKKSLEYDSKGKPYYAVSKFKKYPSPQASIDDYANHMRNGVTWDHKYYSGVWRENAKNYQAATKALNAKYSTNGSYATHLNKLINTYHLDKLDVSYSKVSYRDGTGSETAKVVGNGYNLYNHVSNTAGSASKGSASQLAGKQVYMDCTANKDNQSTWYRIRVAGSNTKYWVDGRALQLRKIDYVALPANATMTFNGKSSNLRSHVYNSDWLSLNIGNAQTYKHQTFKTNSKAIIYDYNGSKMVMYRVMVGNGSFWAFESALTINNTSKAIKEESVPATAKVVENGNEHASSTAQSVTKASSSESAKVVEKANNHASSTAQSATKASSSELVRK